jgi:hypothetical protein
MVSFVLVPMWFAQLYYSIVEMYLILSIVLVY